MISVSKNVILPDTERLTFRRPELADLKIYASYLARNRSLYVRGPFRHSEAKKKLSAMIGQWEEAGIGRYVFLEKSSHRAIGHVGTLLSGRGAIPEMTWTIWNAMYEGKGYAYEAGRAYLDHAAECLGFEIMIAYVKAENLASRTLAVRLGGILNPDHPAPDWFTGSVCYEFDLTSLS